MPAFPLPEGRASLKAGCKSEHRRPGRPQSLRFSLVDWGLLTASVGPPLWTRVPRIIIAGSKCILKLNSASHYKKRIPVIPQLPAINKPKIV